MPQFLSIYTPDIPSSGPPSPEHMAEMGKLIDRMNKTNALVAMGATVPGSCIVRLAKGQFSVTDLPKTGEQGFAIMQTNSKEEAIAMTKEFLTVAGDGQCHFHSLAGQPPQA
jgi:hypothetical protein